ncbi:MAG: alpha,alpha-trehalose-phosphate synthase [Thiomonas sp. 15-66-11]|jgi:hydroxymethylpyrimidine pyrophosphatase-like HAD family hydrolase|nr:MAG: alpha,alpha-trehalose-phosphate synthase [Thiomonas sp. 15-66-11]
MEQTILATDLDGTFLGGSPAQRAALYDWIARHRARIVLIFVSGRGQDFMRQLANELPVRPDHLIGDVGTSVAVGPAYAPLPAVERWLDARWPADAGAQIDRAMRRHPNLRPQSVVSGRRRSYDYEDPAHALQACGDVQRLGFDTLLSDGRFFDVLPRGVQKGPTLLRTLAALGLPARRTLVAGDTLNDLSMFQTGLAGVAVANREAALDAAIRNNNNVYRSPHPGAAGVLDALRRFHQPGDANGFIAGHRLSQATV